MNKITVVSLEKRFKKFEKDIKAIAKKAFKILKKKNIEVEVYLVGDRKMRFLNKKFRGKDKAADVLSFEEPKGFLEPPSKFKHMGEIYLNLEASSIKRQASSLLVHGLLHLLGYRHRKKSDRIKMEKAEEKLFLQIQNPKS